MSYPYSQLIIEATGNFLSATDYNNEHQNHITNNIPTSIQSYSTSTGVMQTQTSPGGVGTESLAADLGAELARIRYVLAKILGTTYWYDIANGFTAASGGPIVAPVTLHSTPGTLLQIYNGSTLAFLKAGSQNNGGLYMGIGAGPATVSNILNSCSYGYQSFSSAVHTSGSDAYYCTAIGVQALADNTSGYENVAVGFNALGGNTTGASNVAVGTYALQASTTASQNVGVGNSALTGNTTGAQNTAVGWGALQATSTVTGNTAVGFQALNSCTAAINTGIGVDAGDGLTSGSSNTLVGGRTGTNSLGGSTAILTTGSNNTALGDQVEFTSAGASYRIGIGSGTIVASDNLCQIGGLNGASNAVAFYIGNGATFGATTNQLILGTTNTTTLSATAPSASRTYTIPDAGGNANVLLDKGNYTISGTWTSPTFVTPALGTPASGTLTNCTFPTLNQNTTGSAASLSISGQTGLLTFTGLASTNRAKTVRDAADTVLELGGSYTPTGTWTSLTLVTPVLGTPTSGTLTNCAGYLSSSGITGITGGGSAAAGMVGEVIQSIVLSNGSTTSLTNNAYADFTSINVTAGKWAITCQATVNPNGATFSANTAIDVLISTTSGNTGPSTYGDNAIEFPIGGAGGNFYSGTVTNYIVAPSSMTTYYAKVGGAGISAGTPKAFGRITAIRIA